jgi:hypothetical protein
MQRRLLAVIAKAARDLCRAALGDKLPGYTRFHSSLEIKRQRGALRSVSLSGQNRTWPPRLLEHRDVSGILDHDASALRVAQCEAP